MEWHLALGLFLGSFLLLLFMGVPVAFAFLFVNMVGVFFLWGGLAGFRQLILAIFSSVGTFALMPIALFILLGEVMFMSGMAKASIDALDQWVGRIPGRLSLLAVAAGTMFATMSGLSIASTAMLGSVLVPEMTRHGYKKSMSMGPIMGSGGLAPMIPPTALGVLLAALAKISVGGILVSIILPGLLMAFLYVIYIVTRCIIQPSIAPAYKVIAVPMRKKVSGFVRYVLPLGLIVFLVIGVVFLGIATPAEGAAGGALAAFVLAAGYRKLNWKVAKKTIINSANTTVMILIILVGAMTFSQLLAFTGITSGITKLAVQLPLSPLMLLVIMQLVVLFLGCFMEPLSIMMVTLPVFMPVVHAVGLNPLSFGTIMLLNVEMALLTPPFGMALFVMKSVAPSDTTMGDVYRAALPFVGLQLIVMVAMMLFPALTLWLPGKMIVR